VIGITTVRSARRTYPLIGILLGILAPLAALLIRIAAIPEVRADIGGDLQAHRFFYLYQLFGTCLVFGGAGWFAGRRAERLQNAESFYQSLAEHDALTGLYNERAFRDRYSRALERGSRTGQPIALLLIDVDHLKRINDHHGHRTGNKALIHVANALRDAKRSTDSAARWGGDEFAILLEGADENATRRVAENVLERVRSKPVAFTRGQLTASVTIGAATMPPNGANVDLFAEADRALYAAKRAGRNRVHFAD
jgi:diguanylate cyclase (GGDEF)-like protein